MPSREDLQADQRDQEETERVECPQSNLLSAQVIRPQQPGEKANHRDSDDRTTHDERITEADRSRGAAREKDEADTGHQTQRQ
jgi:hypothetical protein